MFGWPVKERAEKEWTQPSKQGIDLQGTGTTRETVEPYQYFVQQFIDKSHVAGDGPLTQGATVIAQESG